VTDLQWQGSGPVFTIRADGRQWRLDLDCPNPCLAWSDQRSSDRLLGLDHVAATGRRDESAFIGSSLVAFERHRGRIQATYRPSHWRGLNIRAAWGPTPDRDGFDLEIQVWNTSAGVFRRLEVAVVSTWTAPAENAPPSSCYRVEPRDLLSAALSYDGREPAPVLRRLTTMPVASSSPHELVPVPHPIDASSSQLARSYVEMVRPNDCARRILADVVPDDDRTHRERSTRYSLFGHDLEKGVVLRGRLRGAWLPAPGELEERHRRYEAFLAEPPPLGP
jgi:hypothetical protein